MSKTGKVLLSIAVVLALLAALAGAALSALAFVNTREVKSSVDDVIKTLNEEVDDVLSENDVCIANEYYIRDTSAISDAYKSGDTSALDDRQKETLKMASEVLESIVTDEMTQYEKEEAVYKWLTSELNNDTGMLTVIPNSGEDSDNPYGVLKYRSAVCVGFATTFRLFMHMMDIDCMVVHDSSLTHSWDEVKLDDEWYYTDCYFDAGSGNYRYFNVSQDVLLQDHSWNTSFFPKATGLKYNYSIQHAEELEDFYAIPAFVRSKIDEGVDSFSCKVKGGIAPEDQPAVTYLVSSMDSYISALCENGYFQSYWALNEKNEYVLCMFMHDYGNGTEDIPEEVLDKINSTLSEVFGDVQYYYDD